MSLINFSGENHTFLDFVEKPWVAHDVSPLLCRQHLATLHFQDLPGTVILGREWRRKHELVFAHAYAFTIPEAPGGEHWFWHATTITNIQKRIRASLDRGLFTQPTPKLDRTDTLFQALDEVRDRYHLRPEVYGLLAFREKIEKIDIPSFNYRFLEPSLA